MAYLEMRERSKGDKLTRKVYKAKELLEDICEAVEEMEEEYGSRDDEDYDERGGSGSYRRGGYRRRSGGGY